ncbi:MAG: hypothetical protein Q4G49_05665 [Paracoccus sp. (in: a-proteobacteria)]|nr:hypothetical protein [Paracoccus sp. (in: a-proteobacteria)]
MSFVNEGRTFSAMFDTRTEADRAVVALHDVGVHDVVVHGENNAGYDASRRNPPEDRGFFEALADFFFPEDDRASYAEGLHRGGYLVTARNVPEDLFGRARDALDQLGSVDLDAREREWRDEGWDAAHWRGDHLAAPAARSEFAESEGVDPELTQPLDRPAAAPGDRTDAISQDPRIGRRDMDLGTARVRSYVREARSEVVQPARHQDSLIKGHDTDQPPIRRDDN